MCILLEEVSHLIYIISSLNHLSSLYTAAPVIDTPSPSNVTVNVGDHLTLSCTSRGSPPDTFTWQRADNSTVLQSSTINAVNHTNMSAEFRANYSIANVTTSDSGTYICTVTNPIGSDSANITVKVTGELLIYVICNLISIVNVIVLYIKVINKHSIFVMYQFKSPW